MTSHRLPLSFFIDPDSTFDTLEMVLAIARRIGLRLLHLRVHDARVFLELGASDDGALALFSARLGNVIGIDDIRQNVCMLPIAQKCRTLHAPDYFLNEKRPCR